MKSHRIFWGALILFIALPFFGTAQDFFEEEPDSVLWYYDTEPKLSLLYIATPQFSPYGCAVWIHHPNFKFSTYLEFRGGYSKEQTVIAVNEKRNSVKEVSANKLDMIGGIGLGSTIYENYLWYFNFGIKYSNYSVSQVYISDHKMEYESPYILHFGGGISAVFLNHLQLQIGIDLESFLINGGVGFAF